MTEFFKFYIPSGICIWKSALKFNTNPYITYHSLWSAFIQTGAIFLDQPQHILQVIYSVETDSTCCFCQHAICPAWSCKSTAHLILTSDISSMCFNHTSNLKNILKQVQKYFLVPKFLVNTSIISHGKGKKTVAT
jgi:hypothetical protein